MNKMSKLKIVTFEEISREWLSLVRMQVKESSYFYPDRRKERHLRPRRYARPWGWYVGSFIMQIKKD